MKVLYLFDDRNDDSMFNYDEAERVIQMAREKLDPELMIVFGSVARGTANDDSDLDLIVVKDSDEDGLIRSAKARRALEDSKIPIDIIVYTPEEFKLRLTSKYSLPYEALATGKIVYG
jgi:predicted nucleotidyltransferase